MEAMIGCRLQSGSNSGWQAGVNSGLQTADDRLQAARDR